MLQTKVRIKNWNSIFLYQKSNLMIRNCLTDNQYFFMSL